MEVCYSRPPPAHGRGRPGDGEIMVLCGMLEEPRWTVQGRPPADTQFIQLHGLLSRGRVVEPPQRQAAQG